MKLNRLFKKFTVTAMMVVMGLSGIVGCSSSNAGADVWLTEPVEVTDYKLNTYVALDAYSTGGYGTKELNKVLSEALGLCDKYEKMFSRTLVDSDLYRLNSGETNVVSEDVGILIEKGLEYAKASDGAFDITIGAVSSLWDFTADYPVVPADEDISNGLKYVDYTKVSISKNADSTYTVNMPEGTIIDLGAIAKGYIADKIKDFLLEHNIRHAIINLGGNVLCVGAKRDDTAFNIGVKKPFTDNEYVEKLKIKDMSVVSSGNYERFFYNNGKLYHHILNPKTGYPYDNGISEVTIISKESFAGDCLSTTCFALGVDKGLALIESLDGIEAVFVDSNGDVTYSSGFTNYR